MTFFASLLIGLLIIQGLVMAVDEFVCHYNRHVPAFERIGHPVDTLCFFLPIACAGWLEFEASRLITYAALSILSTLVITKDEGIHARLCGPLEQWLHALLFVVHAPILILVGVLWASGNSLLLLATMPAVILLFGVYQLVYWNFLRSRVVHESFHNLDSSPLAALALRLQCLFMHNKPRSGSQAALPAARFKDVK